MARISDTFGELVHDLPDNWTVAEFDVQTRDVPEHLRGLADERLEEFKLFCGAHRESPRHWRFRISATAAGLPDRAQAAHGVRALDVSGEGQEITLVGARGGRASGLPRMRLTA